MELAGELPDKDTATGYEQLAGDYDSPGVTEEVVSDDVALSVAGVVTVMAPRANSTLSDLGASPDYASGGADGSVLDPDELPAVIVYGSAPGVVGAIGLTGVANGDLGSGQESLRLESTAGVPAVKAEGNDNEGRPAQGAAASNGQRQAGDAEGGKTDELATGGGSGSDRGRRPPGGGTDDPGDAAKRDGSDGGDSDRQPGSQTHAGTSVERITFGLTRGDETVPAAPDRPVVGEATELQRNPERLGVLHEHLRTAVAADGVSVRQEAIAGPVNLDGMPRHRDTRDVRLKVIGATNEYRSISYTEHTAGPDGHVYDTAQLVKSGDTITALRVVTSRWNNAERPGEVVPSQDPQDVAEVLDAIERATGVATGSGPDGQVPSRLREEAMRRLEERDAELEATDPERTVLAMLAAEDKDPYGYRAQAAALIRSVFSPSDQAKAYSAVASFALDRQDVPLLQESMRQLSLAERWQVIAQEGGANPAPVPPEVLAACNAELSELEAAVAGNPTIQGGAAALLDIYASQLVITLRDGDRSAMNAHLEKLLPVATSELRAQFLRSREQSGWVALAAAGYDPFFLPGEEYYGRATVAVTKVLCLLGQADHPRAATAFFRGIASREDRRIAAPAYEAYARRAGLYRLQTGHGLLRPLTRHPGDMPKNVLDGRSANPHVMREVDPWSYVVHALPKLIMGPQAQAGERVPVEYVEKLDPEDLTALMRTGNVSAIRGYYEALAGLPNGVPYRHHQSMVEMALFLSAQSSQSEQTDGHTTLNNSEDVTAAMEMQSLRQEAESMHTGLVNEQGLEAELLITCHAIGEMPFSSLRIAYALEAAAIRQRYQVHTPQSNEAFDRLLYQIWSVASATLPARGDTRLSELWQQLVAVGFTSETFYRIEEADHPNED